MPRYTSNDKPPCLTDEKGIIDPGLLHTFYDRYMSYQNCQTSLGKQVLSMSDCLKQSEKDSLWDCVLDQEQEYGEDERTNEALETRVEEYCMDLGEDPRTVTLEEVENAFANVRMSQHEVDPKVRFMRYSTEFHACSVRSGIKWAVLQTPHLVNLSYVEGLEPPSLKDRMKKELEIVYREATWNDFKNACQKQAARYEQEYKARVHRKRPSAAQSSNEKKTTSNGQNNGKGKKKQRTDANGKLLNRKGKIIECGKCNANHFIRDCPTASEEEKKTFAMNLKKKFKKA